jgi:hypothetical protein
MRRRTISEPPQSEWDSEANLLIWLATCVSVISLLYYFRHAEILLYGDAIAHINIARRVFDSRTPGLLQLGTVWLPLPHLLIIPFILTKQMWQQGVGGSVPSMVAYVFGVLGVFRLVRGSLSRGATPEGRARVAAWFAAIVYAANPNLIYMQTTAMGEALYLALFIWSVVYFSEYLRGNTPALVKCGICVAAACLTRYDGWFLALSLSVVICVRALMGKAARADALKLVLIASAAPLLWLAYNGVIYRNPLEFENGPYSAKAIERRTQSAGNPGHPGSHNTLLASLYFMKSAEANVAQNEWVQRLWILLSLAAVVAAAFAARVQRFSLEPAGANRWWPLLFLLVPLPFYALSIAYGGVPIFIPYWWPFTHYNARYGLQLLPAFAVALAVLIYLIFASDWFNRRLRLAGFLVALSFVVASYASVWRATPICLAEAQTNMRTRNQLQVQLAVWLEKLPPNATLLMYVGDFVGAAERAGLPLKQTINEGNHRVWKQPSDPGGLWERALANPSQFADYVLAFEDDPVYRAVQDRHLRALVEFHVTGQPRAILYRAR